MSRRIILLVVIVGGLLLASCGGTEAPSAPPPPPPPPPSVPSPKPAAPEAVPPVVGIDASKIYSGNCAACHGPNRQGVPGLAPALTPESQAARSDAEIRGIISQGRPGTAMTAFDGRLSSEEIGALVELIKRTAP